MSFEEDMRDGMDRLVGLYTKLSNNVGDIHARVIRHDIEIQDLKRGVVRKSDPPKSFEQWHSPDSRVYHIPEAVMDEVAVALEKREKLARYDAGLTMTKKVAIYVICAIAGALAIGLLGRFSPH